MKKKIKYIYVDDEPYDSIAPLIDAVEGQKDYLKIDHKRPVLFSQQVKTLREAKFDGLILDLRLDRVKNDNEEVANYRAFALAQELRTLATEGKIPEYPIVLWSTSNNLERSFSKDDSSRDNFDAIYDKDNIPDQSDTMATELISLVQGYEHIKKSKKNKYPPNHLLSLKKEQSISLDPALMQYFDKKLTVHEIARFILNELIRISGPLVNEDILAARLGVDIKASADWESLKAIISKFAAYKGPFSSGWSRWWASFIESWWASKKDHPGSLRRLSAEDRIKYLKKITNLHKLHPAKPILKDYSNQYWTVCLGYNKPLDPINGMTIARSEQKKPWQDKEYVSIDAVLKRKNNNNWIDVSAWEKERLKDIKKIFKTNA